MLSLVRDLGNKEAADAMFAIKSHMLEDKLDGIWLANPNKPYKIAPPEKEMRTMVDDIVCFQCGRPMFIDDSGCSHHWSDDQPDNIDYDRDADHVPYSAQDEDDT